MGALHAAATAPWVHSLALLCLCAAYLQGGWYKALNFRGAVAEVKALGLTPAAPIAAAVLVLQLAASALILTGWYTGWGRWPSQVSRCWRPCWPSASVLSTHFLNTGAWSAACCSSPGTI